MNIDVCVVTKDGTLPKGLSNIPYKNLIINTDVPLGRARMLAIQDVSSEFFAFIDDDMEIEKGWLEELLLMFDNPKMGAVCGWCKYKGLGEKYDYSLNNIPTPTRKYLKLGDRGYTHNVIFRTSVVKDWRPSHKELSAYEDYELTQHVLKKGYLWLYTPSKATHHISWHHVALNSRWAGGDWRRVCHPSPFTVIMTCVRKPFLSPLGFLVRTRSIHRTIEAFWSGTNFIVGLLGIDTLIRRMQLTAHGAGILDKIRIFLWSVFHKEFLIKGIVVTSMGHIFRVEGFTDLKHVSRNYEMNIRDWFKCPEDGVFLDAGAAVGGYTISLAPHVSRVIAFEACPSTYETLFENVSMNNLKNVDLFPFALWDKGAVLPFYLHENTGANSLILKDGNIGETYVNAVAFDEIVEKLDRLDLIKMDIEGAELRALHGMEKTLKNFMPRIIVEIKPQNAEKVVNYLKSLGFVLLRVVGENHLFEEGVSSL